MGEDELIKKDISDEVWRKYLFDGHEYTIQSPKTLCYHKDGTTHRIVDKHNIVHCVPAPGYIGCVLLWFCGANCEDPVRF